MNDLIIQMPVGRLTHRYMSVHCPVCRSDMHITGRPYSAGGDNVQRANEDGPFEYMVKSWWTCKACQPCEQCSEPVPPLCGELCRDCREVQ